MDFAKNIQSQYLASLAMLRQVVIDCPDSLWQDSAYRNVFWNVTYHALFYTHLYMHPGLKHFKAWDKHRPEMHRMQPVGDPYSKADVLEFMDIVCQDVPRLVVDADLTEPSGFDWLPFNRLEAHMYNIRHLHQHLGELSERLGEVGKMDVRWLIKP